jgi:hypothetical protein
MNDSRPVDPHQNRRQRFKQRARMEYLAGAEEEWRKRTGRPMTGRRAGACAATVPGGIQIKNVEDPRGCHSLAFGCVRCGGSRVGHMSWERDGSGARQPRWI